MLHMHRSHRVPGHATSAARTTTRLPSRASVSLHSTRLRTSSSARCNLASAGKQLIALDFDGVVCDSCGESSLSAFKVGPVSSWAVYNGGRCGRVALVEEAHTS